MESARFNSTLMWVIVAACFASVAAADLKGRIRDAVKSTLERISLDDSGSESEEAKAWDRRYISSPEECARPCVLGAPPKTCYYHFTVEYYSTMSSACDLCRTNTTTRLTEDCQCIDADMHEASGLIVANRMSPGPAIMVCLNDFVVVDVENHVTGAGITIHWHGVLQKNYQYFDGVPYVTQCPIPEATTFRYQFGADNAGTHFWHAHTGMHKAVGLEGSLIIREPPLTEPNSDIWDFDNNDNVIFLTDIMHDPAEAHFPGNRVRRPGQSPDNFLINGLGLFTDPATGNTTKARLATLTVKQGFRYRFRMINSCSLTCPLVLSIEGHDLTVIASDGENVEPVVVNSIASFSAERYDFVIDTNKPAKNYWIQVRGLGGCARRGLQQLAVLHYETAPTSVEGVSKPTYQRGVSTGVVLNQLNVLCNTKVNPPNTYCVSNLRSARRIPRRILKSKPDIRLYLPINFHEYETEDLFKVGTYQKYLVVGGSNNAGLLGNISHVSPPSPLLTQREDIPESEICSSKKLPARCRKKAPCACTHVEELPLNSVVEVMLVDEAQVPGLSHPFHLHGHSFHIIGQGCAEEMNITSIDLNIAMDLDRRGKIKRHLTNPPAKDTYAVPNNGYTIIRFIANNPGYWLFHCHFLFHLLSGMTNVFRVGDQSNLPPIPKGFPKCGNYLPPLQR